MELWKLEIEDEHFQYGGTQSSICDSKETCYLALKKYLNNRIKEQNIRLYIPDNATDSELDKLCDQLEAHFQNEYSRWEYGGRYYITISKVVTLTKKDFGK